MECYFYIKIFLSKKYIIEFPPHNKILFVLIFFFFLIEFFVIIKFLSFDNVFKKYIFFFFNRIISFL